MALRLATQESHPSEKKKWSAFVSADQSGVCLLGRHFVMFMSVDLHFGAFLRLGTFCCHSVHLFFKLSFQF